MGDPSFMQLTAGWNAEPNAPHPRVMVSGTDILVEFVLNSFQFEQFGPDDQGIIRFLDCSRYRFGATNDEGWYRGQCRYSKIAPAWGEFYEISGPDSRLDEPDDWKTINEASSAIRHFLFYFRDHKFECIASDWRSRTQVHECLVSAFQSAIGSRFA